MADNGEASFTSNVSDAVYNNLTAYTVSYPDTANDDTNFVYHDIDERVKTILTQPNKIVALILGFFAISMNILSVMAILKIRGPLSSHYRFILSLAMSDILIGASVTLHIINNVVNPVYYPGYGPERARLRSRCVYVVIKALNSTALNITLLNLMVMAIDHFLAIVRPLHYPTLMNKHRASVIICLFWVIAILCGFSDFMSGYPKYLRFTKIYNYCEFVFLTKYQEEYTIFATALLCFILMTFSYAKILKVIRSRHHGMNLGQESIMRNQKAVITTLLILGTFVVCWLPMCLFQIILIIQVKIDPEALMTRVNVLQKADEYLYDLLMLNAICDPIIYAVRMREIQNGYRRLFQSCRPKKGFSNHYNGETTHTSLLVHDGASQRSKTTSFKTPMAMAEFHPNTKKKVSINSTQGTLTASNYSEAVGV